MLCSPGSILCFYCLGSYRFFESSSICCFPRVSNSIIFTHDIVETSVDLSELTNESLFELMRSLDFLHNPETPTRNLIRKQWSRAKVTFTNQQQNYESLPRLCIERDMHRRDWETAMHRVTACGKPFINYVARDKESGYNRETF